MQDLKKQNYREIISIEEYLNKRQKLRKNKEKKSTEKEKNSAFLAAEFSI